tara:strand:+ start:537 stop:812 length:276 start_codon:yes stop_codon:yes gene_type:complete
MSFRAAVSATRAEILLASLSEGLIGFFIMKGIIAQTTVADSGGNTAGTYTVFASGFCGAVVVIDFNINVNREAAIVAEAEACRVPVILRAG